MICFADNSGNAAILLDWQVASEKHGDGEHHWRANHHRFRRINLPVSGHTSGGGGA